MVVRAVPGGEEGSGGGAENGGCVNRAFYAAYALNDVHLTEKLQEVHGLAISRASVRRLRLTLGLPAQRPRRAPAHRSRRPRADAAGRLVQLDGSQFAWLEDRAKAASNGSGPPCRTGL